MLCAWISIRVRCLSVFARSARPLGERADYQVAQTSAEVNTMANYVDGFILPIPKKNAESYRRMARKAGKVWREHGALEYRECVADDVKPGKWTSFPQSVKLKPDEVVWFS